MASIYQKVTTDRLTDLMKKIHREMALLLYLVNPLGCLGIQNPAKPKEHSFDYVKAKASMMYQYKNDSRVEETDLLIIASKMEGRA